MPHQSSSARRDNIQLSSGITVECTISTPVVSHAVHRASEEEVTNLAICLHPWSWLGGRMNDPSVLLLPSLPVLTCSHFCGNGGRVLQLVTEPLLDAGYTVLRYNSRGVGKSTGRASFTGSSEADDLKDLVQCARSRMPKLRSLVLIVCLSTWPSYANSELMRFVRPGLLVRVPYYLSPPGALRPPYVSYPSLLPTWPS